MNSSIVNTQYSKRMLIALLATFLYVFAAICAYSTIKTSLPFLYRISIVVRIVSILIFGLLAVENTKTMNNLLRFMIVVAFSGILYLITVNKEFYFIILFLIIYGIKEIEFDLLLLWIYKFLTFFFWCIVLMSVVGLIENIQVVRPSSKLLQIPRFAFGFTHPNVFGFVVLLINLIRYFTTKSLTGKYISKVNFFQFLLSLLIVYFIADSRTSAYILVVVHLLLNLIDKNLLSRKNIYYLSIAISIGVIVVTIVCFRYYDYQNTTHRLLNSMLSNRLGLMRQFYLMYGIHPLGNLVEMTKNAQTEISGLYFYLDSGVARMLIEFGSVFTIIFSGLLLYSNHIAYKKGLTFINVYTMILMVYSISQDRFMVEPLWGVPVFIMLVKGNTPFSKRKLLNYSVKRKVMDFEGETI